MSTCWKCGRQTPDGRMECDTLWESGDCGSRDDALAYEFYTLENDAALCHELKQIEPWVMALTRELAAHLDRMGALAAKLPVKLGDNSFILFIKKIK